MENTKTMSPRVEAFVKAFALYDGKTTGSFKDDPEYTFAVYAYTGAQNLALARRPTTKDEAALAALMALTKLQSILVGHESGDGYEATVELNRVVRDGFAEVQRGMKYVFEWLDGYEIGELQSYVAEHEELLFSLG
ncbi:hypothetical protein BSL82_04935 [Tardibacter chloracetimidivorans]|uniref:Uncharacterized protein n=1 Tax=Tardibacter chloracetimidivorans TaxID=1921510 RepID=A0A1L3ZT03_9SPHN|nr:hypothetical protein [Tardibacter chloracetimidivorans]API58739.1 hypothetical protein BSL82_04935 [Tardibacter chloracetimidivorans]